MTRPVVPRRRRRVDEEQKRGQPLGRPDAGAFPEFRWGTPVSEPLPDDIDNRYAHLSFTVTTKAAFLELLREVTELAELSASEIVRRCEAAGKREFTRQTAYNIGGGKNFPVAKNVRAYLTACGVPAAQVEEALRSRAAITEKEQAARRKRTQRPDGTREPIEGTLPEGIVPMSLQPSQVQIDLAPTPPPISPPVPYETWTPSPVVPSRGATADTSGTAPAEKPADLEARRTVEALYERISKHFSSSAPLQVADNPFLASVKYEDPALIDTQPIPRIPGPATRSPAHRLPRSHGSLRAERVMPAIRRFGCLVAIIGAAATLDRTRYGRPLGWEFWFFVVMAASLLLYERASGPIDRLLDLVLRRPFEWFLDFALGRPIEWFLDWRNPAPGLDRGIDYLPQPDPAPTKWPERSAEKVGPRPGWHPSVILLAVAKFAPLPLLRRMTGRRTRYRPRARYRQREPKQQPLALVDRTDLIPPRGSDSP
jgi:hypothetical protein